MLKKCMLDYYYDFSLIKIKDKFSYGYTITNLMGRINIYYDDN